MLVEFADSMERVGQRSGKTGLTGWRDTPALFGLSHLLRLKFPVAAGLTSTRLHWIKGRFDILKAKKPRNSNGRDFAQCWPDPKSSSIAPFGGLAKPYPPSLEASEASDGQVETVVGRDYRTVTERAAVK